MGVGYLRMFEGLHGLVLLVPFSTNYLTNGSDFKHFHIHGGHVEDFGPDMSLIHRETKR